MTSKKRASTPAPPPAAAARRSRDEHLAPLAESLRAQRKSRGMSIEQLAAASGVSRSMISKIERAEAMPSTSVLSRLAEALGVTFSQLLVEPDTHDVVVLPQRVQPILLCADGDSHGETVQMIPLLGLRGPGVACDA